MYRCPLSCYCYPRIFEICADWENRRYRFRIAAIGTVCGAVLGGLLTAGQDGEESWKITAQFAASYIGGGINYAAVGKALETSETMYATGAAADNIMTNVWMVATAVIPVLFRRFLPFGSGQGRERGKSR